MPHKQLPILRAALAAHQASHFINSDLEQQAKLRSLLNQQCLLNEFQQ